MLTDKIVAALLPHPDPKRREWIKPDHEKGDDPARTCRGFGAKTMRSGVHTYIVDYVINGRERQYPIGAATEWRCADARKKARAVRQQAQDGIDPLGERQAARNAPTVADLIAFHREDWPEERTRSQKEADSIINQWILPELGRLRFHEVTNAVARDFHRKVSAGVPGRRATPVRANRAADLARHLWNVGSRDDVWKQWISDNPFRGVKRNAEQARTRYLDEDEEMVRLSDVLDRYPDQQVANLVRFILYTGCRSGEAKESRWDQFNATRTIWTKTSSETKQKRLHTAPLAPMATALLDEIWKAAEAEVEQFNTGRRVGQKKRGMSEFVFPSARSESGHVEEIKSHWAAIRAAAGIADVRVHDLRHSFASFLINRDVPLEAIGSLLGHSQLATTKRYAHLSVRAMTAALDKLVEIPAFQRKV